MEQQPEMREGRSFPERKGQKRKLEKGTAAASKDREISTTIDDGDDAILNEIAAQVSVLNSAFSWQESDRATQVLSELAKNVNKITMDSNRLEFALSFCLHGFNPSGAELTCGEVIRTRIDLETNSTSIFLPDQTIGLNTGPIPLYTPNTNARMVRLSNGAKTTESSSTSSYSLNRTGIFKLMTNRFGASYTTYSNLMSEIESDIMSSTSRGKAVCHVKVLKVRTEVSKLDKASENLVLDMIGHSPKIGDRICYVSTGCVICMEDYKVGSLVAKLPCGHDFHGVCINEWSQIKCQCPLCRIQLSRHHHVDLYFVYSYGKRTKIQFI